MYFSALAVRKKPTKRAETGIEPGSRDQESNALDRSAMVATQYSFVYLSRFAAHSYARNPAAFAGKARAAPSKTNNTITIIILLRKL